METGKRAGPIGQANALPKSRRVKGKNENVRKTFCNYLDVEDKRIRKRRLFYTPRLKLQNAGKREGFGLGKEDDGFNPGYHIKQNRKTRLHELLPAATFSFRYASLLSKHSLSFFLYTFSFLAVYTNNLKCTKYRCASKRKWNPL